MNKIILSLSAILTISLATGYMALKKRDIEPLDVTFSCDSIEITEPAVLKKPADAENYVCAQKKLWEEKKIDSQDFFMKAPSSIELDAPARIDLIIYIYEQNDVTSSGRTSFDFTNLELAKLYHDKQIPFYNPKKAYNLYLYDNISMYRHNLYDPSCRREFEHILTKPNFLKYERKAIEHLHSLCNANLKELIKQGDMHQQKTQKLDVYTITAMYFYYAVYLRSLEEGFDFEKAVYDPDILKLTEESYTKFKTIRNQLPEGYIKLSNDTRFD